MGHYIQVVIFAACVYFFSPATFFMHLRLILSCFFIIQCSHFGYSQTKLTYNPAHFSDTIPDPIRHLIEGEDAVLGAQLEGHTKRVRNNIESLVDQRNQNILWEFDHGNFITDGYIYNYIQSIRNKILLANPSIASSVLIYPHRSTAPNSSYFGEGLIGINLGILAQLDWEDQCAFVLCHELAHFYLEHSNNKIVSLAEKYSDRDFKKQLSKIKRSEYNQYTELKEVFQSLNYSVNQHSRNRELEADSLAVLFYLNTAYNPGAIIQTLALFDSIDNISPPKSIDFVNYFDFESYRIKDEWLEYQRGRWNSLGEKNMPDSIKTHPDCQERINKLVKSYPKLKEATNGSQKNTLNTIQEMALFEIINTYWHKEQYGKAMYLSLLLLESYPEDPYLISTIARSFFEFYSYQKDHRLTDVLDMPSADHSESYDRYLAFINRLRLNDLAAIGYYYSYESAIKNPEEIDLWYALWQMAGIFNEGLSQEEIKNEIKTKFPTEIDFSFFK